MVKQKQNQNAQKNNLLSRWWSLANPHKGYFSGQIISMCVYSIFLSILTIFTARTTTCMFTGNWNGAFLNLALALSTIIIRNIALHIEYLCYTKENAHIRLNISNKIYKKLISCKTEAINDFSMEKAINIAVNNMGYSSEFPDVIAVFISKVAQVLFTLIVVFMASQIAGVIILLLGIVNFFVYLFLNKKLGKLLLKRYEKKDDMFRSYSKVITGKDVISEMHANNRYKNEIIDNVKKFNYFFKKYHDVYSFKVNIYFAIWNVVVYLIAALLMFFSSQGKLPIETYLIIVPYLTTCTEQLCDVFDKSNDIENLRIDVDRVNLILDLSDKELISYGKLNKLNEGYNLGLVNVSEQKKEGQKYSLKNVNMSFKIGGINIVKGPKENGKRVIFDILRRYNEPDKGVAILDNLNLYDYNDATFHSHINYASSYPEFLNATIAENLSISNKSKQATEKICKELGILDKIKKLPKGFKSKISDIQNDTTLFLLGVTRALLTDCKILMIYEFPSSAEESERQKIIKLITKYNLDKTLIIFTHSNQYDKVAQVIYNVEKGVVTQEK